LLQRHRAAVIIQKQIKAVFVRNKTRTIRNATIVVQSGYSLYFVDAMIHPTIFLIFWMFEFELTVTTMMHRHSPGIRYNIYLTP
jgi:hypothetical protein